MISERFPFGLTLPHFASHLERYCEHVRFCDFFLHSGVLARLPLQFPNTFASVMFQLAIIPPLIFYKKLGCITLVLQHYFLENLSRQAPKARVQSPRKRYI